MQGLEGDRGRRLKPGVTDQRDGWQGKVRLHSELRMS